MPQISLAIDSSPKRSNPEVFMQNICMSFLAAGGPNSASAVKVLFIIEKSPKFIVCDTQPMDSRNATGM